MKKIGVIFFLVIYFLPQTVSSQMISDTKNHDRYWYYRHRLFYDFIGRNGVQGTNLPVSIRGVYSSADPSGIINPSGIIKWGDATIDLGWYIGVLATEYKLLSANGQSVSSTLYELHAAIECFNRLDNTAESYYRCFSCPAAPAADLADLNGFFIRDDVPYDFLIYNPGLAQGLTSAPVNTVESQHRVALDAGREPTAGGNDQIWHLLMGFRLVKEYIPSDLVYTNDQGPVPFIDGETKILKEVQNIVDRIFYSLNTHAPLNPWRIYNPVTGNPVPEEDGGHAEFFAYAAAELANAISPAGQAIHGNHHNSSSLAGIVEWELLGTTGWTAQDLCVPGFQGGDNYKFLILAALTNTWSPAVVTSRSLGDSYEHIPLLQQLLHNVTNLVQMSNYEILFNQAPCTGPYNYGGEHYPINEWSSTSRFVHPERRHNVPCTADPPSFTGEYNGLDYMLLHNLWYIAHGGYGADNRILWERNHNYPTSSGYGSITDPANINAFENIDVINVNFLSNSNVTYHAGYMIHFYVASTYPSLSITPTSSGALFHAYVKPFSCETTDGDYRNMVDDPDTSKTMNPFFYEKFTNNKPQPPVNKDYISSYNEFLKLNSSEIKSVVLDHKFETNILPNPNDGSFQIAITRNDQAIGIKEIKVFDIMGKEIWSIGESLNNTANVDISGYAKGIYYIRTINALGEVEMKKFIKQ